MEVRGKVAIVTGAGSGIGRATAERLAHEGASVVAADVNLTGAQETATTVAAAGGAAIGVAVDVRDAAAVAGVVQRAEQEYGGLDIMINNAGIGSGDAAFLDTDATVWGRALDIDLRAVILGTQLAVPAIARRGGGAIVNTASIAGIYGFPDDPVYAAAKAGVVIFTRSVAPLKDSHQVRVNCVCPGFVDTPFLAAYGAAVTDEQRAEMAAIPKLQPEEVADAMLSLITDDSAAGQALQIMAGMARTFVPAPSYADLVGRAAAGR